VPHIQVEIIPDVVHAFLLERPEVTGESLIKFFA
jgi:hypothetical protein